MAENWVKAGDEQQFTDGTQLVRINGKRVVVARLNGGLYAFDALCPHAGGPMELAEIEGTIVSCPLHAWRFDVELGGCELHGYRPLTMREVKVEGGAVYVDVPAAPAPR